MKLFNALQLLLLPLAAQSEVTCSDSILKFNLNGMPRTCTWIAKNTTKRCTRSGVSEHCPSTCGTCVKDACVDAPRKFNVMWGGKERDCGWVSTSKKTATLEKRCGMKGVAATCRATCGFCEKSMNFNRIATFPICSQVNAKCDTDDETVAEIVTVSDDGMTLIYSDSQKENVGFVDITDPSDPKPLGVTDLEGEPTSVAVLGDYAFAGVNTSPNYIDTSGQLVAIKIATRLVEKTWELGGQPDSVAVSPDGKYIVIAIENERDEDLGDGIPPQMPAGFVVVVTTADSLDDYVITNITMTGLSGLVFPEDPEPEFVAINSNNVAVITLQENNGIVLIDLATKAILSSFSAGTVDLVNIDTEEEDVIDQTSSLDGVPREPDGVIFISNDHFVTADEGDMDGGSRGFTIFDLDGNVVHSSGSEMDQISAAVGHYPESRSGNKGSEPENVAFGNYGGVDFLFVNCERSNLVFVYDVTDVLNPEFRQVLPTNVGPEGSKAIASRGLLVVASEKDSRDDKLRSTITIYEFSEGAAQYPTLMSERNEQTGVAIPWSAMSGLSADPSDEDVLYSIEDSYYASSRFFTIDITGHPAIVTKATRIKDSKGKLAAVDPSLVNADNTVNIDQEGIAADGNGNFYIASEGKGTVGDIDEPFKSLNYILKVNTNGVIQKVISLPAEFNAVQLRFGLEGVAYHPDGYLVACLQRAWSGFDGPAILAYDIENDAWLGHVIYPLDAASSQAGGWVGLSDITYTGEGMMFYVLERDNQGGPDAAVKKIYSIDLTDVDFNNETITKTEVADLMDVYEANGALMMEKIEGLTYTKNGIWIINDNDGVDDNNGETQLLNLGQL